MKPSKNIGQSAENFAYCYLRYHGLTPITRNYTTRWGEIDLIMRQKQLLIFIEVRLRNHYQWVSGKESVDYFKQKKLIKAANHYLNHHHLGYQQFCRFDVIDLQNHQGQFKVEWVKHAFELSE